MKMKSAVPMLAAVKKSAMLSYCSMRMPITVFLPSSNHFHLFITLCLAGLSVLLEPISERVAGLGPHVSSAPFDSQTIADQNR